MFKYLKEIFVHYNYVDRNFLINFDKADSEGDKPFRHLIITGKNGSGKTKILEALNEEMSNVICGIGQPQTYFNHKKNGKNGTSKNSSEYPYPKVEMEFYENYQKAIRNNDFVYAYLGTDRSFEVTLEKNGSFVETLDKLKQEYRDKVSEYHKKIASFEGDIKTYQEDIAYRNKQIKDIQDKSETFDRKQLVDARGNINDFKRIINNCELNIQQYQQDIKTLEQNKPKSDFSISKYFLQYLLGKKDQQVFAIGDEEHEKAQVFTQWFKDLNKEFQKIFENPDIKLKHKRISSQERKFYFELPDGRTFNFDQLSHGYNNIFAIVAEIWLHIEAYQAKHPDDHNPRGLVIIDELETHLHLSLQEKILPFLTGLFPNIQFVIATHSPVIMASETDCVIYDLDEKYTEKDNITGTSYTVLMTSHLGLGSEYSLSVTKDLNEAKKLLGIKDRTPKQEKRLRALSRKLGDLSPTLALEIILAIEKYAEAE